MTSPAAAAQTLGAFGAFGAGGTQDLASVLARDERSHLDIAARLERIRGDRRAARGAQARQARALGQRARARRCVVDPPEQ